MAMKGFMRGANGWRGGTARRLPEALQPANRLSIR